MLFYSYKTRCFLTKMFALELKVKSYLTDKNYLSRILICLCICKWIKHFSIVSVYEGLRRI